MQTKCAVTSGHLLQLCQTLSQLSAFDLIFIFLIKGLTEHRRGILYNSYASINRPFTGFRKLSAIFSVFHIIWYVLNALDYLRQIFCKLRLHICAELHVCLNKYKGNSFKRENRAEFKNNGNNIGLTISPVYIFERKTLKKDSPGG